jgi:hypothetical protein
MKQVPAPDREHDRTHHEAQEDVARLYEAVIAQDAAENERYQRE